jgi:hypothetical protein
MNKLIWATLFLACASTQTPTSRLLAVKSTAMKAGYAADLPALAGAARDAKAIAAEDPKLAAMAHYWAGYALWQRAVNDVNLKLDPAADREAALAEFDAAIAAREAFADAHALAAWLHGWLWAADPANKDAHQKAVMAHITRARELEPDNPRVLWEQGYVLQIRDRERGLKILDDLAKRPFAPAPTSLEPDWGVPEALMVLAYNYLNAQPPDVARAETFAKRALELQPHWQYVESILMPQIEQAKHQTP